MDIYCDNEDCRISYEFKESHVSIFCFTGVGLGLGGINSQDIQREEFQKSVGNRGCNTIYILDKKRTWYASDHVQSKVNEFLHGVHDGWGASNVVTIGNSMGGTGSIVYGDRLNANTILSFCPQSTVSPALAPFEKRYKKYVDSLPFKQQFTDIATFRPRKGTFVFFGTDSLVDLLHAERLLSAGYKPCIIQNCAHDIAAYLKKQGHLAAIVDYAVQGKGNELDGYLAANLDLVHEKHVNRFIRISKALTGIPLTEPDLRLRLLTDLSRIAPMSARLHMEISRIYDLKGDPEQAVSSARDAIALDGDNADYHYYLVILLSNKGDVKGAVDALAKAHALST